MSVRPWMWFSVTALVALGCARPDGSIGDATVSALLGAPSFTGKWRCKPDRLPGTRWYERVATSCTAEDSIGTTSTLVHTIIGGDGSIANANRVWWNRDSAAWMARRDSIARAVLARFPNATRCHGIPAAYAPPPEPPQPGTLRDQRAWRAPGYDVEISMVGPASSASVHGGPIYTLSLGVAKAPGWMLDCATEAQLSKITRPNRARTKTETAWRR